MFKKIEIQNYKSIKDLTLNCKKINLFIGKPNVGKSNILEAISLFQNGVGEHIRLDDFRNLFFDQDISQNITVSSEDFWIQLSYQAAINKFAYVKTTIEKDNFFGPLPINEQDFNISRVYKYLDNKASHQVLPNGTDDFTYFFYNNAAELDKLNFVADSFFHDFKILPYLFRRGIYKKIINNNKDNNLLSLHTPFGENLFTVLKNNKTLLKEVAALFKEYGYNLVIDFVTDEAEIQKNVDGVIYKIPYNLVADTLQRMIFYYAAIYSNENSALLFEEPENNSFPPYIRDLAFKIIESPTNQFFIATHSPYLFNTMISEAKKEDIAVFVVTFDNFQTKVKELSSQEVSEISDYGVDVFFNLNLFES